MHSEKLLLIQSMVSLHETKYLNNSFRAEYVSDRCVQLLDSQHVARLLSRSQRAAEALMIYRVTKGAGLQIVETSRGNSRNPQLEGMQKVPVRLSGLLSGGWWTKCVQGRSDLHWLQATTMLSSEVTVSYLLRARGLTLKRHPVQYFHSPLRHPVIEL